jgi:Flp pilus assembly protein TadG
MKGQRKREQKGQALIVIALAFTALVGFTGLVTDGGFVLYTQRAQQNASDAAAQAGASLLNANSGATDLQVFCAVQLYASTARYNSLAPSWGCPAAPSDLGDNLGVVALPAQAVKGQSGAWYVDHSGTELAAVGSLLGALPVLQNPSTITADGVRVYSTGTAPAYFSRVFGFSSYNVNTNATFRFGRAAAFSNPGPTPSPGLTQPGQNTSWPAPGCAAPLSGSCTTVNPAPGNPGQWQSGINMLPTTFLQSAYATQTLYSPYSPPATMTHYTLNLPANPLGAFNWSGLQCTVNNGNDNIKSWLSGTNPCPPPAAPLTIALQSSSACSPGPPPSSITCSINVDPGVRDTDFGLLQSWMGQVTIVPVVSSNVLSTEPVVQFAYFYVAGYGGNGSNSYISGFFLNPAQMPPLPSQLVDACLPGQACGVSGG